MKYDPSLSELYWAYLDPNANKFKHFVKAKHLLPSLYGVPHNDVVLVVVQIADNQEIKMEDGIYHGWVDKWKGNGSQGQIMFIQHSWNLFNMQFTYGVLASMNHDTGYPVLLDIVQVNADDPDIKALDFDGILKCDEA